MPISPGTRLGPYEVVAPIGAGGMGEVWKARDTRLERSVAIKVLPAEFAQNAQLRLRFEREARTISQLNHPNICTLYDVGEGYLVMELIDGETLADRVGRGPLPLDQLLRYGIEIATALDRAHKAGVVHRDLKPANVMIAKSGAKLLDFGLARPSDQGVITELTSVRTEQRKSLTEEGTIIGTFQYMAPEQLEGAEVDARTDIFAFGALLYEMATGRRAFEGKSKASLIASILTVEPQPLSAIQPMTPAALDRLVRGCLRKDPDERWQSAHDVAEALKNIREEWSAGPAGNHGRPLRRSWLWPVAAVVLAAVAAVTGWAIHRPAQQVPLHVKLAPPTNSSYVSTSQLALAPDGGAVAFAASDNTTGRTALWIESLRSGELRRVPGSDDVDDPIWSPDGTRIAWIDTAEQLRVLTLRDGTIQTIGMFRNPNGSCWLSNDEIITSDVRRGLFRVNLTGGAPLQIVTVPKGAVGLGFPQSVGEGAVAFRVATSRLIDRHIDIRLADGSIKTLAQVDYGPWPAPKGMILFSRRGQLFMQRVDAKRGVLLGLPRQVGNGTRGAATDSILAFLGAFAAGRSHIAIADRQGHQTDLITPDVAASFRLSPDGRRFVMERGVYGSRNIWIYEMDRAAMRRVTFSGADDFDPVWTADGQRIVFSSTRDGAPNLYITSAGGTGVDTRLIPPAETRLVDDVSSVGRVLFVKEGGPQPGSLWTVDIGGRETPQPLMVTPFLTAQAVFSPDGKYVAYRSDEAGVDHVFVVDYPAAAHKWQISTDTGYAPKWSRDGRTLYFAANGKLYEVPMRNAAGEIDPGQAHYILTGIAPPYAYRDPFEPMPDGRFLLLAPSREATPELHIVAERIME